jgi:hypothetical protein
MAIPAVIAPDLASHVVAYAAPGDDGLVFTSQQGAPLRRSNLFAASGSQLYVRPGCP